MKCPSGTPENVDVGVGVGVPASPPVAVGVPFGVWVGVGVTLVGVGAGVANWNCRTATAVWSWMPVVLPAPLAQPKIREVAGFPVAPSMTDGNPSLPSMSRLTTRLPLAGAYAYGVVNGKTMSKSFGPLAGPV